MLNLPFKWPKWLLKGKSYLHSWVHGSASCYLHVLMFTELWHHFKYNLMYVYNLKVALFLRILLGGSICFKGVFNKRLYLYWNVNSKKTKNLGKTWAGSILKGLWTQSLDCFWKKAAMFFVISLTPFKMGVSKRGLLYSHCTTLITAAPNLIWRVLNCLVQTFEGSLLVYRLPTTSDTRGAKYLT